MSGDPIVVWICLLGGMLLQLIYMIAPFQRWDWARFLGSAALPMAVVAKQQIVDHEELSSVEGLVFCGMFTLYFALMFQERLLPRLGEGVILMWSAVLVCVIVELRDWQSPQWFPVLAVGFFVGALTIVQDTLSRVVKLVVYAWFLFTIVLMAVLQFDSSDFSLMADGRTEQIDHRFAVVDGMAGAYIGIYATFLFELLPIPGKGESWAAFKSRWGDYLNQVVARFDGQRLDTGVAVALVAGIAILAYANHWLGLMPDRALASLILFALPVAWRTVSQWRIRRQAIGALIPASSTVSPESGGPGPADRAG
jgi:hypothetical protein